MSAVKKFSLVLLLSAAVTSHVNAGENPKRYLLYDCYPDNGFNLRRDVYMRMANLVKLLRSDGDGTQNWILVLPPWGRLRYHWDERGLEQSKIPWKTFFDVKSLSYHVPVMEYEEYVEEIGEPKIEEIWYLQHYAELWENGTFVEKIEEQNCTENPVYTTDLEGKFRGWFWGFLETYAVKFKCVSTRGRVGIFVKPLNGGNTTARSVLLDRGEIVMEHTFGGKDYWDARRSMVFAEHLTKEAAEFRKTYLDSDDESDKTIRPDDWRKHKAVKGSALGGPYIGAHLRRNTDYLWARNESVPSIKNIAEKMKELMKKYEVNKVFVASDGTKEEMEELKRLVPEVVMYEPPENKEKTLRKGEVAIIDQIICSHARYFIGTKESRYSFRIHDEREIMGFDNRTTYNCLCGDAEGEDCEQPRRWKVVWEDDRELWEEEELVER